MTLTASGKEGMKRKKRNLNFPNPLYEQEG